MEGWRRLLLHDPMEIVYPLVVFAVTLAIGYGLTRLARRILDSRVRRSGSRPVTILRDTLRGPGNLFALIFAIHVAVQTSDLPDRYARWGARTLLVLLIF